LRRLVYVERHDRIEQAIQRESLIKSWPRAWKVRLITGTNPNWEDLYDQINGWPTYSQQTRGSQGQALG
jgi:putative endonuclease